MKKAVPKVSVSRMIDPQGGFKVVRKGVSNSQWGDLYHWLVSLSWPRFLTLISLGYVTVNTLFALAYLAGGDGIANAHPGSFLDAFFSAFKLWHLLATGPCIPKHYTLT